MHRFLFSACIVAGTFTFSSGYGYKNSYVATQCHLKCTNKKCLSQDFQSNVWCAAHCNNQKCKEAVETAIKNPTHNSCENMVSEIKGLCEETPPKLNDIAGKIIEYYTINPCTDPNVKSLRGNFDTEKVLVDAMYTYCDRTRIIAEMKKKVPLENLKSSLMNSLSDRHKPTKRNDTSPLN